VLGQRGRDGQTKNKQNQGDATMQENYEEDIKWFKKEAELHELAMQQNKDRMRALEEELHKAESDLAIAKREALRQFNRNRRLRQALRWLSQEENMGRE
jgi:uncharacterized protein (DUF342 family)